MSQTTNGVAAPKTATVRPVGPNGEFRHNRSSAIAAYNKRGKPVLAKDVDELVKATIQGTPQFLAKGHQYEVNGEQRENMFDRMIYNLLLTDGQKAESLEGKQLFTKAVAAEDAGDVELAHELFNAWLNYSQITFSVIDNPTTVRFERGDMVKGIIGLAPSSADPSVNVITFNNPTLVGAKARAKVVFDASDFLLA